jgi:periplasmic copper chaperone A
MMRKLFILLAGAALVAAPAAGAHVTTNPSTAPAGGVLKVQFQVPHGCEGSPTTSVSVRMPAGVGSVKPEVEPGWQISVKEGRLPEPVEVFGETVTEGVTEVTWTGGPLADDQFTDFGINMLISGEPGETKYFPTVQRCRQGVHRWITIPVEGQEEPDEPAPGVELTAAEGGTTGEEDSAMASETEEPGESEEDDAEDRANLALGFGIGGLVSGLGALGLAFFRRRP